MADEDEVRLRGKWTGTWKEDCQKATGKLFTKTDVEIYRFKMEGQITEHHSVQSISEIGWQIDLKTPGQ